MKTLYQHLKNKLRRFLCKHLCRGMVVTQDYKSTQYSQDCVPTDRIKIASASYIQRSYDGFINQDIAKEIVNKRLVELIGKYVSYFIIEDKPHIEFIGLIKVLTPEKKESK